MVTGYNVDIRQGGKVFHVQTEDRGRKNPVIETLIYEGGQILHQEKISYADQNDDAHYDEQLIWKMLDHQHQRLVAAIRAGKFDDRKPFGEEFITKRTFDECVLDFLVAESSNQALDLVVVSQSSATPGQRAHVVVRATRKSSGAPIAGAAIRSRIIRSSGAALPLPELQTDANGEARVEFVVPEEDGNAAVIVQAESDAGRDEVHRLIL